MWTLLALALVPSAQAEEASRLYERGVEHYNAGDFGEATELLERAATLRSDVPDYRFHLGLAYLKSGRAKDAARELEAALGMMGLRRETRLKEPLVLVQAAIAYLHVGNYRTARARAESALKKGEPTADVHYILGLVEREEGNASEAIAQFRLAVELDRDHPEANVALAEVFSSEGRLGEARDALRHATHRDGGSYGTWMALGELAYGAGDLTEAGEAFGLALEARPDDHQARYNLGTVRLAEENYDEAIEWLAPLEDTEKAAFNLAEAYRGRGSYVEAGRILRTLVERSPDWVEASFALGIVLEALGEVDAAEQAYRAVLAHSDEHLGGLLNLASLLESSGRPAEAIPLLEKALELGASDSDQTTIREALESLRAAKIGR